MTVKLLSSAALTDALRDAERTTTWFAVTGTDAASTGLDPAKRMTGLAQKLEDAFTASRETWWQLGRQLIRQPTGDIGHMTACASFGSDFGIMLAWLHLVDELALENERDALVICDDPWLFRALATVQGVDASAPPAIFRLRWKRRLRGIAARLKTAIRLSLTTIRTRRFIRNIDKKQAAVVVYGHPQSREDGYDAYFGDLLQKFTDIARLLHTDCPVDRARELSRDLNTASLHAFGHPCFALFRLPFVRWHPNTRGMTAAHAWLVDRAQSQENSGGGPAMNVWQMHCQARWLQRTKVTAIAWPWENFSWERALVRSARHQGVRTVGYQHTVVGPHQFNYSVHANPDGFESIPDTIAANGPAYRADLIALGMPEDRIVNGGAFRFKPESKQRFDPEGPVFVPLSANLHIADYQIEAGRKIAAIGRKVIIKPHPMYPVKFETQGALQITDTPFDCQSGVSAMLYTTGASGLEALLAGVPCIRLCLTDRVSIDILPNKVQCPTTSLEAVVRILADIPPISPLSWFQVFSSPEYDRWKRLLLSPYDRDM